MYRLLLSLRYLRTRFIALASIISVTLGVATMIVVNSVMSGFSHEMHQRLHGILSDIVIESHGLGGFDQVDQHVSSIRQVCGDDLEGITTVVHVPAMLNFQVRGQWVTRQINLIGIDATTYAGVSDFGQFLIHPENQQQLSFALKEGGYGNRLPHEPGWTHRRARVSYERAYQEQIRQVRALRAEREALLRDERGARGEGRETRDEGRGGRHATFRPIHGEQTTTGSEPIRRTPSGELGFAPDPNEPERPAPFWQVFPGSSLENPQDTGLQGSTKTTPRPANQAPSVAGPAAQAPRNGDRYAETGADPFAAGHTAEAFDEMNEQYTGVVLGIGIVSVRQRNAEGEVEDYFMCLPGDDVKITFPTAAMPPQPVSDTFTIVDLYESKMSEYDSSFAFVPLSQLQRLRGMIDPATGKGAVTSIQIKLKEGADLAAVRDRLRVAFPPGQYPYRVQTWREMQGPLLAAVQMETTILNILLFLIIAVAGFGILATFYMIVVEKTKDIGILKSLGAPSGGVMSIFLTYGLSLGIVGSGVGAVLGVLFVVHINEIAAGLEFVTGREVFDPTVYYFQQIPTIISPMTVAWVATGAVLIAVLASVLPAVRAARLHPVEALRYE